MDIVNLIGKKLRGSCCDLIVLALWAGTLYGQSTSGAGTAPQQGQVPASDSAAAKPETTISPKEAKELFRSVDEILQFASQDTDLPIKHKVKRRLTKRDEVQEYLEKNMKEDKDAKRLERSSAVLKKFGLLPRDFDLGTFLVALLKEQVAGADELAQAIRNANGVIVEGARIPHDLMEQALSEIASAS